MDDAYVEVVPGVNPATGLPDGRFDGRVTASVAIGRLDEAIHATPNPHAPALLEAVASSDLVIATELGVGLADLLRDERHRDEAAEARRAFDPRRH